MSLASEEVLDTGIGGMLRACDNKNEADASPQANKLFMPF